MDGFDNNGPILVRDWVTLPMGPKSPGVPQGPEMMGSLSGGISRMSSGPSSPPSSSPPGVVGGGGGGGVVVGGGARAGFSGSGKGSRLSQLRPEQIGRPGQSGRLNRNSSHSSAIVAACACPLSSGERIFLRPPCKIVWAANVRAVAERRAIIMALEVFMFFVWLLVWLFAFLFVVCFL